MKRAGLLCLMMLALAVPGFGHPPVEILVTDNRICKLSGNHSLSGGEVTVNCTPSQGLDYALLISLKLPGLELESATAVSCRWRSKSATNLSFSGKGKNSQGYKWTITGDFEDVSDGRFQVTGTVRHPDGTEQSFSGVLVPELTNRNLRLYDYSVENGKVAYLAAAPGWELAPAYVSGYVEVGPCKLKAKATFLKFKVSGTVAPGTGEFLGDPDKVATVKLQKLKLKVSPTRFSVTH